MTYPNATHVSPHLSWRELACHDEARTPYPPKFRARAIALGSLFEMIRGRVQGPITIGSAYRTEAHNRKPQSKGGAGGSRKSQHVQGRALDLHLPSGWELKDFLKIVLDVAHLGRLTGIGVYPWGIHIDIRPSKRIVRWKGSRVSADLAVNV